MGISAQGKLYKRSLEKSRKKSAYSCALRICTTLETRKAERLYEDSTDRELQEVYVLELDQPLEHYYLDCKEVSVLYEAPLQGAIDLYRNGGFLAVNGFDCQGRTNNALLIEEDLIAQAREDTAQILEKIQSWLRGREKETI